MWLVSIFVAIYIAVCPIGNINDSFYPLLFAALLSIALSILQRKHYLQKRALDRADYIVCGVFTVLFLVMLPVTNLLKSGLFTRSIEQSMPGLYQAYLYAGRFLLLPLSAVSIFHALTLLFSSCSVKRNSIERKSYLNVTTIAMAIVSVAFLLSAYPAIFHDDGVFMWSQAIGREGWTDWHPVTYIFLLYICNLLTHTPFAATCLQTVLWILTMRYAFSLLEKEGISCGKYFGISLITCFIMYSYTHVLYKDVLYTIGLFGFSLSILDYVNGNTRKRNLLRIAAYGFLTAATRHAALVPVIITLMVLMIWIAIKHVKPRAIMQVAALSLLPVIILYVGVRGIISVTITYKENPGYVTYTVPLHMLGAYAATVDEVDEETQILMEKIMPVEKWKEGYEKDPYLADTLSRSWGIAGWDIERIDEQNLGSDIIKANWRFFSSYPKEYLNAFFKINSLVWSMGRVDEYGEWYADTFANCSDTLANNFPELDVKRNVLTELLEPISQWIYKAPIVRNFVSRGGWGLFALILSIYTLIRGKKIQKGIAIVPIALTVLLLMLSIPAQDPRFIMPITQTSTFFFCYCFGLRNKEKAKELEENGSLESV